MTDNETRISNERLDEMRAGFSLEAKMQISMRYKREAEELLSVVTELQALRTPAPADGGCVCQACFEPYAFDVLVPDDTWESIRRGANLLCPTCIFERTGWSAAIALDVDINKIGGEVTVCGRTHVLVNDIATPFGHEYGGEVSREQAIARMAAELENNDSFSLRPVNALVWATRLYDAALQSSKRGRP